MALMPGTFVFDIPRRYHCSGSELYLDQEHLSASVLYLLNCVLELWSEVKIIAEINKPGAKARLSY